jgi:hypothetical protein
MGKESYKNEEKKKKSEEDLRMKVFQDPKIIVMFKNS